MLLSTFTGNLNVEGVPTYEDVTNVDSVGLITANDLELSVMELVLVEVFLRVVSELLVFVRR